jgi:hypothetical protein
MFRLPQSEGSLEGRHKDHPVIFEGYLADDFTQLVRVLLPKCVTLSLSICPRPLTRSRDTIPLSPLNWVSVLKLSTVWNFEDVRRKAIDSLAGFALDDPIARFLLLSQYNVEEWRIPLSTHSLGALSLSMGMIPYVSKNSIPRREFSSS